MVHRSSHEAHRKTEPHDHPVWTPSKSTHATAARGNAGTHHGTDLHSDPTPDPSRPASHLSPSMGRTTAAHASGNVTDRGRGFRLLSPRLMAGGARGSRQGSAAIRRVDEALAAARARVALQRSGSEHGHRQGQGQEGALAGGEGREEEGEGF